MVTHPFLSPGWIEAAHRLRDEFDGEVPPLDLAISVNVTVTDTPFDADAITGHIDTSSGALLIEEGHLEDVDLTLELPYELAQSLFIGRDFTTAMQAFLVGQIKVSGDSSKLLQIQPPSPEATAHPLARELARRLDEITD